MGLTETHIPASKHSMKINRQKKWRLKNREKLLAYHRKRWQDIKNDPEKLEASRKSSRDRYHLYRDEKLRKAREYSKSFASLYSRTGVNARKRGLKIQLTLEEFTEITKLPCAYCGDTERRHGIDRVDNAQGYIRENSVSCCRPCNYMKNKMTLEEFKEQVRRIYQTSCV